VTRTTRLSLALVLNVILTVGLVVAGRSAHSTGLMADAGHNLTDAAAVLIVLVAEFLGMRPATARRSYGLQRASILAAFVNGVVLLAVTGSIAWFAIARLLSPHPVHGATVLIAATISAGINLAVVRLLVEGHEDLSMRSAWLHAVGDVLGSAVVAISGLVALLASGPIVERIDPIASLLVAGLIITEAFRITRGSVHILLEGVPADLDLDEVRSTMCEVSGVIEVHDLHVWSLSSASRALSAHLVIEGDPMLSAAAKTLATTRTLLLDRFNIDHATMELEANSCEGGEHHERRARRRPE